MSEELEKSALEKWLERKKKTDKPGISKKPKDEPSILSHGQERLWLLEQLYAGQNLYTYAHRYSIQGSLNKGILLESFRILVEKHEVLRTTYQQESDQVIQQSIDEFELPFVSLNSENEALNEHIQTFIQQPFDLSKDLPVRLGIHEKENHTEIILVLHHIAGDAWSMNVINKELSSTYTSLLEKEEIPSKPLSLQYADYAFWQRGQKLKSEDLTYWKTHLAGETGHLNLPKGDFEKNFKGQSRRRKLSKSLSEQLRSVAKNEQVTSYVFWLASFQLFLSKYTNQTALTVGSPFSNRDKKELEDLIGFFNETLVLKADLEKDIPFTDFVKETSKTVLNGIAHKNVPFETLVNELNPDRAAGDNPLFSAMFLYNAQSAGLSIPDLIVEEEVLDIGVSKFDLTLFVNEGNEIELVFEHSASFSEEFVSALMGHYETMLTNVVKNPRATISSIQILSESELDMVINQWNTTEEEIPQAESILDLISPHFTNSPHSIAVTCNDEFLTYEQLDQWSNFIAEKLIAKGVKSNEFVGIYTHRSVEMIVSIVGILKAGAAYLPLDPKYPDQRLQTMLEDAGVSCVLVHPDLKEVSLDKIKIEIERGYSETEINTSIPTDNYAYIIYTSGSTGKPKGVPVSHKNLIYSTSARYTFYDDPPKRFLLLSSFSFDSSIVGIFWTLTTGGSILLPPEKIEQDINTLSEIIESNKVTHTLMLPSLYQVLLNFANSNSLNSLTVVMVAGEAVSSKVRQDHFSRLPESRLYNEYGPTETSVWCVAHEIQKTETDGAVPIGKPVPNYQAYVLDRHKNPMPATLEGELFIGGQAVTGGYLNKPELSAQKFVENPFGEGQLYRTGDVVKWRDNGILDFLCRKDDQVKIRGQRVEKDEIKSVLLEMPEVQDAEVRIFEEKNILIAYIQSEKEVDQFVLNQKVKRVLPEHMIPAHYLWMQELPKLPNGKIDSSKLPKIEESTSEFVAPRNELEKKLAKIWQQVLLLEKVGINDNFFEMGGDSIQSIKVIAKAQKENIQIEPTAIFKYQTIAALADGLLNSNSEGWSAIVPMKTSGHLPPLFCLHSGGAHVMFYREFANLIGESHPVYAIQPRGLDSQQTYHQTIPEMAEMYIKEIKKVQAEGPYHLLGTCFSNAVGLDMIHQLKANGDDIAVFYVIDSGPAYLVPPSPNGEKMPVRRMLQMVQNGNWSGIYKKFRNRFIYLNRRLNQNKTSEVQKDLYEMVDSLNKLYANYYWEPIDEKVVLVRSTEFARRNNKQFHIDHWTKLSSSQLETHVVEGHHKTLFQQPEVKGLAELISTHKLKLNEELISNE